MGLVVFLCVFVNLPDALTFEKSVLNLKVVTIAFGKVTQKPSRSAIAQGVDQCPNTVIHKISFAPNLGHNLT